MKFDCTIKNRTFEMHVSPEGIGMVSVTVWEVVRPTWKIFRSRYVDSGYFWIDDYSNIRSGAIKVLAHILKEERVFEERAKKWKEFSKTP
jgi:hypothetical protein